jgi:hypothetical protein
VSQAKYLVARFEWQVTEDGSWHVESEPVTPVELFAARVAAEDAARRLERAARAAITPFRMCRTLDLLTTRDATALASALRAIGLPPLGDDDATWPAWWEEHAAALSDDARNLVWDVFELLRFYRVDEVEVED